MISSAPASDVRAQEVIEKMRTQLKTTAIAVAQWRREHGGPMAALDLDLQRRVVKLLEEHSWEEVRRAVGVSKSQLASWRRAHREHLGLRRRVARKAATQQKMSSRRAKRSQTAAAFVALPMPIVPERPDVEVKLPSGVVVSARGNADLQAVGLLVNALLPPSAA